MVTRQMRAAIAILMACALVFAPASALAGEHAEDRSYEVTVSEDRAEIHMPRQIEDETGETMVAFDTAEGNLTGSFALAEDQAEGEQLTIALHQIVEFRDEDEDGQLSEDDDLRSAWRLSNASRNATMDSNGTVAWQSLEQENVTSDDGVEGTQVQAVAAFGPQSPIEGVIDELGQGEQRTLAVNLTVFEEPAELNGQQVPAHHVHVDWTVEDFPYTEEDTQLALVTGSQAPSGIDVAEQDNATALATRAADDGLDVEIGAHVAEQALVDGEETDVGISTLEPDEDTQDELLVSLAYERGTTIEHGVLLGSDVAPSDRSVLETADDEVSSVPSLGLLAMLGVLGTAALIVTRR